VSEDAPVETTPDAGPVKVVDAKVVKIMKEKQSALDGLDDTGGVSSENSDDGDRECHTPILKEVNQIFHTCAQDVQITRMTNSKVNNSQCYNYNINRV
jgi:hypothetical protein